MSATSRPMIVVDANVAIWAVLPVVSSIDTLAVIAHWRASGVRLIAPGLWLAECASAIRSAVQHGLISLEEGLRALDDVLLLEVDPIPITQAQTRAAFAWSTRLGQRRAYDGFYLALAEDLRAEFWSVDRRLVASARQAGATWIHAVEERVE
ncbi:MAG TPA: type II toxin-antitoxin system VapC family toxin [Thermomicrobiaceae bacterium]|nr:type II toxin-antitoxin system VapC family toxin [Thermomicrobiaceae bacterium]